MVTLVGCDGYDEKNKYLIDKIMKFEGYGLEAMP